MTDFALDSDDSTGDTGETVLPTFVVLARFRREAASQEAALAEVQALLSERGEPFDQVLPEREEPDGAWMVLARFVVVSVDSHTAVAGVDATLRGHGLPVDEVWADAKVA